MACGEIKIITEDVVAAGRSHKSLEVDFGVEGVFKAIPNRVTSASIRVHKNCNVVRGDVKFKVSKAAQKRIDVVG